jgi:N-acetylglucosaminyl-diphospho-decaprenol L-rhamnosyltransferase
MKVFISVISHGHEKLILDLNCLATLSQNDKFEIVIKNNISLESEALSALAKEKNIHFLDESYGLGFGENNNYVFNWCCKNLNLKPTDWFLVLNPDVLVDDSSIINLVEQAHKNSIELATINLYKDNEYTIYDNCVRSFPTLLDFISSYIGLGNRTILDKRNTSKKRLVDWAAGSFLLFKSSLYRDLAGFDPNYFMYCEDIDICWRAKELKDKSLMFYPDIKAIHFAEHANRSLFSKHFIWHVKSMVRYLLVTYKIIKPFQSNKV